MHEKASVFFTKHVYRLQILFDHPLGKPICKRWDAQCPYGEKGQKLFILSVKSAEK